MWNKFVSRKICSIENCGKPVWGHGLCSKHYQRMRFHGDPLKLLIKRGEPSMANTGYLVRNIKGKSFLVHRAIMEEHLGRKLLRTEIIHHINGDKTDNRIENMEIIAQSSHISCHRDAINAGIKAMIRIPKNRRCDVEGCGKKHKAHGLCDMHYDHKYRPNRWKS